MNLVNKHCVPCEGGTPPFTIEQENEYSKKVKSWFVIRDTEHKLRKVFSFKNFKEAIAFTNKIADIAEAEGHHPDIYIFYNKVRIELYTHAVGGLSENDFIMAAKIDSLF